MTPGNTTTQLGEQLADAGAAGAVGDVALALELAALECAELARELFASGNVAGMIAAESCADRVRQLGGRS